MSKAGLLIVLLGLAALPAGASQFRAFDRAAQVAGSEVIVTGRVLSTWVEWSADRSAILTHAEVAVDEVWKGSPAGDRIVATTVGGTLDGVSLEVDGAAVFAPGEEVLLFLDEADGRLMPWGMRFGKYEVVGSGAGAFLVGSVPPAVSGAQKFVQVSIPLQDLRAEVAALLGEEEPR